VLNQDKDNCDCLHSPQPISSSLEEQSTIPSHRFASGIQRSSPGHWYSSAVQAWRHGRPVHINDPFTHSLNHQPHRAPTLINQSLLHQEVIQENES